MNWSRIFKPWRRHVPEDTSLRSEHLIEMVEKQQREVDWQTRQLNRRRRENNFTLSMEELFKGGDQ